MKIKTKLCLIFGIILTLILAITTLYGLYQVDTLSLRSNDELLQERATLKVKALDEKLNTIFSTLQMASQEVDISDAGEVDTLSVYETLKRVQAQLGVIESYCAVENGVTYDSIVDGAIIEGFNAKEKQREWYLKVFRDHEKMYMTKPYFSVTTNMYVIGAGVPVQRNGKDVGVLCIDIELGAITQYIAGLSTNKNFFVTNEDGTIFASKDPEEVGKNIFEIFPKFKNYKDKATSEFDFTWGENKDQKYKMYEKSLEILPWSFWQYESYSTINAHSKDFLNKSIVFFAIFLVLSLIIVYIVARLIASPIIATAEIISTFAATGNTNLKEDNKWFKRKDEIGVMAKTLNQMIEVLHEKSLTAKEIANGNLEVKVSVLSKDDHLGVAFDQMANDLNSILSRVNMAVNQVNDGAAQIKSSSSSLSDGATSQAASIEEISASITELSGQTKTNAENAEAANRLAAETADAARDGQERMGKLTSAMTQISANAEATQKVIKTIDDIAFQTNLLALNAAVEAARAGIHGKGFAVVAEEVRSLAARSAKAAAETAELIQNSNNQITEGVLISEKTAESLSTIAENVVKTSDTIQEISAASNEQAEGISQIGIGLNQIDTVTQQNTANAEEVASSTMEMSNQAAMLHELIQHFRLRNISSNMKNPQDTYKKRRPSNIPISRNQTASNSDWGQSSAITSNAAIVNPNDQINLDDEEFGKF